MTFRHTPLPIPFPMLEKGVGKGGWKRVEKRLISGDSIGGLFQPPLRGGWEKPHRFLARAIDLNFGYNAGVEFAARPPSTRTCKGGPNALPQCTVMLIALDDFGDRIEGKDAYRGEPYTCPACNAPVTLKRGAIVIPHFAHQPQSTCPFAKGESPRHLEMKSQVGAWLRGIPECRHSEYLPHIKFGPRGHRLIWMDRDLWWKR